MPMTRQNGRAPHAGEVATGPQRIAVAGGLAMASQAIELLRKIAAGAEDRTGVAFGGDATPQKLDNWPVPRHSRVIAPNRSKGGIINLAAGAFTDIAANNKGRAGLQLVNYGAQPCFVYLAAAGDAKGNPGLALFYLSANGGTWDGKFSSEVWCGPLSAQSPNGTTLTYGEF